MEPPKSISFLLKWSMFVLVGTCWLERNSHIKDWWICCTFMFICHVHNFPQLLMPINISQCYNPIWSNLNRHDGGTPPARWRNCCRARSPEIDLPVPVPTSHLIILVHIQNLDMSEDFTSQDLTMLPISYHCQILSEKITTCSAASWKPWTQDSHHFHLQPDRDELAPKQ